MFAIEADQLTKSYGAVQALDGVDLEVESGTVLGVLGPNGAGKTTAVGILSTLHLPTGGRATVGGYDVVTEAAAVRCPVIHLASIIATGWPVSSSVSNSKPWMNGKPRAGFSASPLCHLQLAKPRLGAKLTMEL